MKSKGLIPGRHDYTPPARTAEDDRTLLNWLSTRVADNGLDPRPHLSTEQVLVENRIAFAHALGLTIQPGVYLAPGSLTHTPRQLDYADFLVQRSHMRRKAG